MPPRSRGAPRGARGGSGRGGGAGQDSGRGRGGGAEQPQPAHQLPAAHITTVGVKRPDYGKAGRPLPINVNSFTATVPDGSLTFPVAMNMRLIKQLQDHVARDIFENTRAVFDGRKNLFAPVELDLGQSNSREFDVTLPGESANRDRPPKIYKVRLTQVAKINTEVLHRFIRGQQSHDNTALNVVIRMEPSLKYPVKGRSFFTPDDAKAIGSGLVLWRGYFQSIRPAVNRMLINVDISTGVMYKPGPLIDLCLEFLQIPNATMLSSQMPDRNRLSLARFIAGIRVQTADAGSGALRTRVVRKLSKEGASQLTFSMRDGGIKTVANYYREVRNQALRYPALLCVEIGQGALIPLELCTVPPGQLVRKEVPDDKKTQLVEFATMAPKNRLTSIQKGMEVLAYGQSEYVRKFGLAVDPTLLTTQARVLKAPSLKYGPGSNVPTVNPNNGSWNMRVDLADKRFYRPATIGPWVLIIFESMNRFNDGVAQEVIGSFVAGCRSTGITVQDPSPIIRRVNGQGNIPQELQAAGAECFQKKKVPPTLFVVILPEGGNDLYTIVKQYGVTTQCLKSRKCTRAKIQFWANVALKINVKLGGINVVPDPTAVTMLSDPRNPTVVLGADVMHPGVDSNAAKYVTTSRVQTSRQELITDLKEMTEDLLKLYMSYRGKVEKVPPSSQAPKRLIFYRDGVSEGQFQQVLDHEACKELKIKPTITLVVVGKRHHVRYRKLPRGTVVDRDIGHPTEFDFYLQSHGGLLGPAVQRIIHRAFNFSPAQLRHMCRADSMQALSFALCHVYAGSTRSVSIPAPVYYADKVCARAKIHFDPQGGGWSESGATEASEKLEAYKKDYLPLHSNQSSLMYFSVCCSFDPCLRY
ncbi:ribonuclease H-like domain-containing protein [Mycena sp. CBHHK59/15]|nr:ribonuclease H-like domain-containing protein [Mycena sp. CBHHK59/15]